LSSDLSAKKQKSIPLTNNMSVLILCPLSIKDNTEDKMNLSFDYSTQLSTPLDIKCSIPTVVGENR
jgi:hypothetical protein